MSSVPEEYCRQKAAASGSSFYYSTLYFPPDIKRKLYALHAFNTELEELIIECNDPGVARMKLGWWAEETQRLHEGQARHPVTRELAGFREYLPALESVMLQLINHYDQQINMEAPENYQELMSFLARGPGLLWQHSASVCEPQYPQTPEAVSHLGCQFAWFHIMQNSHDNLEKNRNYWPRDEATAFGEKEKLYAFQINRLMQEMEDSVKNIAASDRFTQLHAIVMVQIILRTCEEIAKSGYLLDQERINLTPLRKFWIAWRTYRKEKIA